MKEKYRPHKCTFSLGTSLKSYRLARDFTEHCRSLYQKIDRLEGLRLSQKADFIDSVTVEYICQEKVFQKVWRVHAKYKSQPFRQSCPPTLFIGRDEMLLSN